MSAILRFAREKPLGAAGGCFFLIAVLVAVLAPVLAPYDPTDTDVLERLALPSTEHWMGTDALGRDVLSRVIYGAQISMLVGISSVLIGSGIGAPIGLVSGYLGRRTDMVVQRIMDVIMTFPSLILAIAVMAVLGNSLLNVILAIAIPMIPRANRLVRSVVVAVKEFQFVEAAKAAGATQTRIMLRHLLPNCLAAYLIYATSTLAHAIIIEASLSFLGLGVPPPAPSWGRSVSEAMEYLRQDPLLGVFPGLAVSAVVFGISMFGDALRDIWDPRLKRL